MDPLEGLLTTLAQAAKHSNAAKDRAVSRSSLTKALYDVLLVLAEGGASSPSQLAAACGVSSQAMGATVKRLRTLGLITESVSPHDRRLRVLSVSPRGQAKLEGADEAVRELDQKLREAVEPMTFEDFRDAVRRVSTAASDYPCD